MSVAANANASRSPTESTAHPSRNVIQTSAVDESGASGNLQAGIARTATRAVALYFSRPVRLFRPTKVSGWHIFRSMAQHEGTTLSPKFLSSLVKTQGFLLIPKHFIPPIVVNACLSTVLFTTYTETAVVLDPYVGHHPTLTAAISGGLAGGVQALVAAPAENVRRVLEGGSVHHSWSHAWKEVFRGTAPAPGSLTKEARMNDIRQLRTWMKDVGDMAGRGWDGWGWGLAKDVCGFAVFFSIFEVTRRVAIETKSSAAEITSAAEYENTALKRHLPRTVHGIVLVTGGVFAGLAYEAVGRPWDVARRTVEHSRFANPGHSPYVNLLEKLRNDGILTFFRDSNFVPHSQEGRNRRLYAMLRTLGRVGPWGVGFLVWETYGSTINL